MSRPYYTVSEVARPCGVLPRVISDLFYSRRLDDARCPIIGGRRLIPEDYISEIKEVLRELGHLPTEEPAHA